MTVKRKVLNVLWLMPLWLVFMQQIETYCALKLCLHNPNVSHMDGHCSRKLIQQWQGVVLFMNILQSFIFAKFSQKGYKTMSLLHTSLLRRAYSNTKIQKFYSVLWCVLPRLRGEYYHHGCTWYNTSIIYIAQTTRGPGATKLSFFSRLCKNPGSKSRRQVFHQSSEVIWNKVLSWEGI